MRLSVLAMATLFAVHIHGDARLVSRWILAKTCNAEESDVELAIVLRTVI